MTNTQTPTPFEEAAADRGMTIERGVFELRGYAVWQLLRSDETGMYWKSVMPDISELTAATATKEWQRERFEREFCVTLSLVRHKAVIEDYVDPMTQIAWLAWQAALNLKVTP